MNLDGRRLSESGDRWFGRDSLACLLLCLHDIHCLRLLPDLLRAVSLQLIHFSLIYDIFKDYVARLRAQMAIFVLAVAALHAVVVLMPRLWHRLKHHTGDILGTLKRLADLWLVHELARCAVVVIRNLGALRFLLVALQMRWRLSLGAIHLWLDCNICKFLHSGCVVLGVLYLGGGIGVVLVTSDSPLRERVDFKLRILAFIFFSIELARRTI